jgi:cell division protein FtsI (penicillin-binding protein 3)
MSAAQMRKMMEGVVLYGTGKPAQLNGYSSGGKTGTAQKVDPATHRYSKTMHVASFAGIAPVNNPVIAVAVVIDNPKGPSYYGTAVSAPVFAEVAQETLEYLGVGHDIDIRAPKNPAKPQKPTHEDDEDNAPDINSLFAAVNDLPADDPLRDPAPQMAPAPQPVALAKPLSPQPEAAEANSPETAALPPPEPKRAVIVTADGARKVPDLVGLPVRKVIETAATAGLEVEITGSGTVREQAPAPGTVVGPSTRLVVRCAR